MTDVSPTPLLEYGHASATRRRLRLGLRLFLFAWAAGTLWLLYESWVPWLRLQSAVMEAQQQCCVARLSPDTVVVEQDPEAVEQLLLRPQYRRGDRLASNLEFPTGIVCLADIDDAYTRLIDARAIVERLQEARHPEIPVQTGPTDPNYWSVPRVYSIPVLEKTIFMCTRTTTQGETRLVRVVAVWYRPDELHLEAFSESLDSWWHYRDRGVTVAPCRLSLPNPIRIFAGAPDPKDPTRFTIDYVNSSGRGRVEGRLLFGEGLELNHLGLVSPTR